MKRRHLPPGMRAFVAFAGTVILALLAAVSVLDPDIGLRSADSTRLSPGSLDVLLPAGLIE